MIPSIRLALVGADGAFDTEDDILVPFTIDYTAETATLALVLVGPSDPGFYRLRIGTTLRDLAGNRLVEPYLGRFR
ncbi:MAG: Ig-like domain-containing protein, partial [Verrucomicrobiales bacterium]|nr:Ig-like domain-containing protein [Verrucomicrobiales bacterium]